MPFMRGRISTTENLAIAIWDELRDEAAEAARCHKCRSARARTTPSNTRDLETPE